MGFRKTVHRPEFDMHWSKVCFSRTDAKYDWLLCSCWICNLYIRTGNAVTHEGPEIHRAGIDLYRRCNSHSFLWCVSLCGRARVETVTLNLHPEFTTLSHFHTHTKSKHGCVHPRFHTIIPSLNRSPFQVEPLLWSIFPHSERNPLMFLHYQKW